MDLSQSIEIWLSTYTNTETRATNQRIMRHFLTHVAPGIPITDVMPIDITRYDVALNNRSDIVDATRNKYRRCVRAFFNWCVKQKLITESPASGLKLKRISQQVDREKAMLDDELQRVLDYTQYKSCKRDHALIMFLADTGCRIGGASNLLVENLDLDNRSAVMVEKGDKTNTYYFGEDTAHALRQWLIQRKPKTGYVFSKTQKKNNNLAQAVRRACLRVGARSLGPHSLRHRKGHQFSDSGISPKIAQHALHHENVETTLNSYYPQDDKRIREAVEKLTLKRTSTDKIIKLNQDRSG